MFLFETYFSCYLLLRNIYFITRFTFVREIEQ